MALERLNDIFGQSKEENNNTMFHLIAQSGYDDILNRIWNATQDNELKHLLLLKNGNGETCLHCAAKNLIGVRAERLIAQMADMGADLDAQEDGTGDTVLHIAVTRRNYELVEWLLEMRVDANIRNNKGLTAYQVAEQSDDHDMMKLFSDSITFSSPRG